MTGSLERQQRYNLELRALGSVDHIAYGEFSVTAKESLVAVARRRSVRLVEFAEDPMPEAEWTRLAADGAHLLVKHRKQEEKARTGTSRSAAGVVDHRGRLARRPSRS